MADPEMMMFQSADAPAGPAMSDDRYDELMAAIKKLQDSMVPQQAVIHEQAVAQTAESDEIATLKAHLRSVNRAIMETKQEIASLQPNGLKAANMARATDHLDAVVVGTEEATSAILGAAEEIDHISATLHSTLKEARNIEFADDIQHQVIKIFEACNFQDLTGQRITKVVNTLRFIEERVLRMIDLWGGADSFQDVEPAHAPEAEGDSALLNGPALEDEEQASQDDIDALFN